ncbi:MAG: gliding motility-associated C-terminal domain-containing protein, partial [Bacteroidetes bacterium]|nr:gliding motility-associated C-terminal domain-containing protein [Bacteroidota bacterium]
STSYVVTVIDSNNCSSSDSVLVSVLNLPVVDLGIDTLELCSNSSAVLDAGAGFDSYLWSDNSSNSTLTITQDGNYWVIVTNYCGNAIDSINTKFKNCEIILVMPNVFSPNNDGSNDYFIPKEIYGINQATLIIYNRWGLSLFETNNLLKGWDGKYDNNNCSDGTYYWIIQYTTIMNETYTMKGFLTLLR